ncbi:hypothetical protein OH809_16510 [Streptomyces sp. NBC_00873]|uniref:hypothetical protein n=1 Tax=unclassified Streptomyces TaxID=2593676 RepID=UPI00386E41BC|nr:hypothetical protein OH809_16510 [Streptomyces sp. NBC_00873]WTA45851.1 hypothetical protein OH821_27175 [Streptomyces sp. NBC_00842]
MGESWVFSDGSEAVSSKAVLVTLRGRIAGGQLKKWLTSSSGRLLGIVTNTERATVMLLDGEGDPGEHAVDPGAGGWSNGFVLANGQHDQYPNEDTVPLEEAFRIIDHILAAIFPPSDAPWSIDR